MGRWLSDSLVCLDGFAVQARNVLLVSSSRHVVKRAFYCCTGQFRRLPAGDLVLLTFIHIFLARKRYATSEVTSNHGTLRLRQEERGGHFGHANEGQAGIPNVEHVIVESFDTWPIGKQQASIVLISRKKWEAVIVACAYDGLIDADLDVLSLKLDFLTPWVECLDSWKANMIWVAQSCPFRLLRGQNSLCSTLQLKRNALTRGTISDN